MNTSLDYKRNVKASAVLVLPTLILRTTQEPDAGEDPVVLQAVLTCGIIQFVSQNVCNLTEGFSDLPAWLSVSKQASLLKVTIL